MILSSSLGVWLKHQFSQTPRFLSEIWLKFWNLEALIWVENGVDYIKDSTANFLSFHLVGQNPYQYLGPTKRTPGCKKCKICHFNVKYDCGTPLGWTINCSINQSHLLAPKASEASWGLSYFKPGVPSGYCCVCESGYCNRVCYRGSSEKWQIHVLGSHFWRLLVTVYFDDGSFKKYGQFII